MKARYYAAQADVGLLYAFVELGKKAEKRTGITVNGNDNYIEWIEI